MLYLCRLIALLCLLLFLADAQALPGLSANQQFIAFSDIHFDPFSACKKRYLTCPLLSHLRKADVKEWEKLFRQYDNGPMAAYHSDTNYSLLKSALNAVQQAAVQEKPKFILVLGDFLSHNFRANYRLYSGDLSRKGYEAFVRKTVQFLALQIHNTLPAVAIYPVIGNNDSYGDDYITVPHGKFFAETAETWLPLLRGKGGTFSETFPAAGYYAVTPVQDQALRLIILNSVLFSKLGDVNTEHAARQQLDWLKQQLRVATQKQQKVWLIFHIPVGVNVFNTVVAANKQIIAFWLKPDADAFQHIIMQYGDNINTMLTSHLHMDGFQILKTRQKIVNSFVPSISPMFGNNPSFKNYSYTEDTLELNDFITYYLNEATTKRWQIEYRFSDYYRPGYKPYNLLTRMQALEKTGMLAQAYQIFYAVSTHSQPITQGKWLPYYWCAVHNMSLDDYPDCLADKPKD